MGRRTFAAELRQYLEDQKSWRTWAIAAQDGIIATAGILLGFAGAGASNATMIVAGAAATVTGMLSAGGAEWAEAAAERESQLSALAEERIEIEHDEGMRRSEIVEYYESKGLSHGLAIQVAEELRVRSPLKVALEAEHGILKLMSRAEVLYTGIGAALAYGVGASIPFAMTILLPLDVEVLLIVLTALLSLTLISVFGARAGNMNVQRTIARTLAVGVVTITVSYLIGETVL